MATAATTTTAYGLGEARTFSRSRAWMRNGLAYAVIGVALVWTIFPVYWIFITSFKTSLAIFDIPTAYFAWEPTLEHYIATFVDRPFLRYMLNSFIVAVGTTILSLVVGTLAAYSLARFTFPGRAKYHVSFWILSTRMMPPIVTIIPLFLFFLFLDLLNTKTALVIAYTGFNLPFVIWMMKGYFQELPPELEESAMVDGDTRWGAFLRILLPLSAPGLAATAIFTLVLSWNEFLFALIITQTEVSNTLPIGISGRITQYTTHWGEISASGFASCIPIVIFAFIVQRHLVRGLSFGAVKG
jgi:multiple sugar transport system permease protein